MNTSSGFINKKVALAILRHYAIFGPLIGGAPFLTMFLIGGPPLLIIAVPFAYVVGIVPALLCGVLTLGWLKRCSTRAALPGPWRAAAFGALIGAVGSLGTAVVVPIALMMYVKKSSDVMATADFVLNTSRGEFLALLLTISAQTVATSAIMAVWTVRRLTRQIAKQAVAAP